MRRIVGYGCLGFLVSIMLAVTEDVISDSFLVEADNICR